MKLLFMDQSCFKHKHAAYLSIYLEVFWSSLVGEYLNLSESISLVFKGIVQFKCSPAMYDIFLVVPTMSLIRVSFNFSFSRSV